MAWAVREGKTVVLGRYAWPNVPCTGPEDRYDTHITFRERTLLDDPRPTDHNADIRPESAGAASGSTGTHAYAMIRVERSFQVKVA